MRCVVLFVLFASLAMSQQAPVPDSACLSNDCTAPETNCTQGQENCTPAVGGGPAVPGCGCQCPGCASCNQQINPVFNKTCGVNLVMILDESGSIGCCTQTVRNAVLSFVSAFSTLNNIGGSANLGLIEFNDNARLVTAPGSNCAGAMCLLDNNYVGQVTSYIQSNVNGASGYSPGGCTNWAAAMGLAHTTSWKLGSLAGATANPDIVLFFTDGQPTVHNGMGACNTNCNANRVRRGDNNFFVGQCNGNHVGGACYFSDLLKERGIKVFLVGIGGAAAHIPNIQLITGPQAWDQQVTSFATAHYVTNANFAQLGGLLAAVAKGLCPCLQDRVQCQDLGAGARTCAQQSNFDARVKITTTANAVTLPANAVTEAFMYYDFFLTPPRWALDIMQGAVKVRTDIINPCNVARQIACGNLCYTIADLGFIPRFFLAAGDVQAAEPPGSALSPTNAGCTTGWNKQGPFKTFSEITRIWTDGAGIVCGARAVDGTLYEFFTSDAKTTAGVNQRSPAKPQRLRENLATPFNFDQLSACSSSTCNAEVEILFVIDQAQSATDYFLSQQYVSNMAKSFDDSNDRIQMAAYFSVSPAIAWQPQLVIFGNQVLNTNKPNNPPATNFLTTVTNAINAFWPNPPTVTSPPRYLLTIVGGPDAAGAWTPGSQTTFDNLRADRKIEAWAVGVGPGAQQLNTMISLSDVTTARNRLTPASYSHYVGLATSSLLQTQYIDQAARMCPRADLCNGQCQGLCLCGVCQCPVCAAPSPADACKSITCPSSTTGCVVTDKRTRPISLGGCLPANPLVCTQYECDAVTGNCTTATTPCGTNCGCTSVPNCFFNKVVAGNCTQCNAVPITCSADVCGNRCDPLTGTCGAVGANSCDDNNGCTVDSCVVKLVAGVQTGVCQSVNGTRCIPPTNCTLATCASTGNASWTCTFTNLTNLFDLCGVCLGDFSSCFFAQINVAQTAGLSAGVVAGVVIGSLIAAALIAFFGRKGYMAYQAKSAMSAPSMHNNAAFSEAGTSGYT